MRLGAYPVQGRARTLAEQSYGEPPRLRAPPSPLRGQQRLPRGPLRQGPGPSRASPRTSAWWRWWSFPRTSTPWFVASQAHPEFQEPPGPPGPALPASSCARAIARHEGCDRHDVAAPGVRFPGAAHGSTARAPAATERGEDDGASGQALAEYLGYLAVERGSSPHTVEAYGRDSGATLAGSPSAASTDPDAVTREFVRRTWPTSRRWASRPPPWSARSRPSRGSTASWSPTSSATPIPPRIFRFPPSPRACRT